MILCNLSDQSPDDFRDMQRHLIRAIPMFSTFARREVLSSVFQTCADHAFPDNAVFLLEKTPVTLKLLRESIPDGLVYSFPEEVINKLHEKFGARALVDFYLFPTKDRLRASSAALSASSAAAIQYAFQHYVSESEQLIAVAARFLRHYKTPPKLYPIIADCLRVLSPTSARLAFNHVLSDNISCQSSVLSWLLKQPEVKPTQQMLEDSLSRFRPKLVRLFLKHDLSLTFNLAAQKLTAPQLSKVWHDLSDYQTLTQNDFRQALNIAMKSSHDANLIQKIASHPNVNLTELLADSPALIELRTAQHVDDLYALIQYGLDESLLHPDEHLVAMLGSNEEFRQYRLGKLSVLDVLLKHGDGNIDSEHLTPETRSLISAWNTLYSVTANSKKTKQLMAVSAFRAAVQSGVSITPSMIHSIQRAEHAAPAVL